MDDMDCVGVGLGGQCKSFGPGNFCTYMNLACGHSLMASGFIDNMHFCSPYEHLRNPLYVGPSETNILTLPGD
jgi:hypothetical protein